MKPASADWFVQLSALVQDAAQHPAVVFVGVLAVLVGGLLAGAIARDRHAQQDAQAERERLHPHEFGDTHAHLVAGADIFQHLHRTHVAASPQPSAAPAARPRVRAGRCPAPLRPSYDARHRAGIEE